MSKRIDKNVLKLRKEKRDNAIKLLNPRPPSPPTFNAEDFKENITTFLQDKQIVTDEIIEIAKYVSKNPEIIETIIEIPDESRCTAYCYNKKRCTKNKKKESQYCGIHIKGTPYGVVLQKSDNIIKHDVILTDIKGVMCYVDAHHNVYRAEDIINKKTNPAIIAKWDGKNYMPIG